MYSPLPTVGAASDSPMSLQIHDAAHAKGAYTALCIAAKEEATRRLPVGSVEGVAP